MPSQPSRVPASAALVAWGNAWVAGHCGVDEVADVLERAGGPQVVSGSAGAPPGATGELPLRRFLGELRVRGLTAFRLALPAPGDPLGLPGPPAFNQAAIEAGEAVLVDLCRAPLGLVPEPDTRGSSYAGTRWARYELATPFAATPTLTEAEQQLALTLKTTADSLLQLDVPRPDRRAAAALAGIRDGFHGPGLAPGYPPRAARVAAQAARLAAISSYGLADDAGTVSVREADARRSVLRELERAVRRARVAAYNSVTEG